MGVLDLTCGSVSGATGLQQVSWTQTGPCAFSSQLSLKQRPT